ncbi:MAG: YqaA family protein [Alphaproteobacteria bacterium]
MSTVQNIPVIKPLYEWVMGLAGHRHAWFALFCVSFMESSFFPIPPDIMLIPMIIAAREQAWKLAAICTIGSVLGGIAGYFIGYGLYETIGVAIVEFYNATEKFAAFTELYKEHGFWIVFTAGFTPIPYKVFTIASGVAEMNLGGFTLASIFGRGARFFLVAALLWKFGAPIRGFVEKNLGWMTLLFTILLIAGFAALTLVG